MTVKLQDMDKVSNRATNHALAIEKYILAKDGNRPDLLRQSFASGATLDMVLNTNVISFPSHVAGRAGISDVLVSRFGETYENVYTFCLGEAPSNSAAHHANKWLVGMSTKATGELRVGCGRYDWHFSSTTGLVQHLTITIEHMHVYPAV